MKRVTMSALAVFLLSSVAARAQDQAADRAAILELIDKAFAAVASGDPDDWRAIQLAEGTTLSFRPDGKGGQAMRIQSNEQAIQQEPTDDVYLERWIGEPTVMIRGPIAVVWGEYEFFINGQRSHCGVDSADVVKVDGQWKVANFMWTVEPDGCPEPPPVAHDISGVWKLVELHDWNPDGHDDGWLGSQAPGLFVYTPEGKLSLHIMTEHERPLIDSETSNAERGEIFGPYIGYFGTY
ncbi:MAG: lipocalin-like domain-containing protein [Wenzhouxiangellaceae bacterium]|nr:lipocalin-like domain-containing protein [Wenzhouxiangellaceae bacterium]